MRLLLAVLLLLSAVVYPASAAIFSVKPGTRFYSKPSAMEDYQLALPEVRVKVPPMKDSQGFCLFELVYKIVDRANPQLPQSAWARCIVTSDFISN